MEGRKSMSNVIPVDLESDLVTARRLRAVAVARVARLVPPALVKAPYWAWSFEQRQSVMRLEQADHVVKWLEAELASQEN